MKVLGAKVSEAVFKSFEQEAVNLGLTKSELLRTLINRFLEREGVNRGLGGD